MTASRPTRRARAGTLGAPAAAPVALFRVLVPAALACAPLLAGCADETPPPASAPVAAGPTPPAAPAPAAPAPAAGAAPAPAVLANDPSAPADTPLCGGAARERVAIDQALLPRQYADAGICRTFACYDPATATYIGADGYRHVCR